MQEKLFDFLKSHITENRLELFSRIIEDRTRYITVVLEDIYQPQNASAVLRSCDCFGIQDVHIIENRNEFTVDTEVSLGSSKWLNLNKYNTKENNTREAIQHLKAKGYKIVATTPHKNDQELQDYDINGGKLALVFGSELPGISDIVMEEADEFLKIPMYGFTESFNISVSAAIVLHHLTLQMRQSSVHWQLSDEEKTEVQTGWIKNTIKRSELLIERFWEEHEQGKRQK